MTEKPKIRRRRRRRRLKHRPKDVGYLVVVFKVAEGLPLGDMMRQVRRLCRARRATIIIKEDDYPMDLVVELNDALYRVPHRIPILVTPDVTAVPHGADARLTLAGPLSDISYREVVDRLYRLRDRKAIGPNWSLEAFRGDLNYRTDVVITEETPWQFPAATP